MGRQGAGHQTLQAGLIGRKTGVQMTVPVKQTVSLAYQSVGAVVHLQQAAAAIQMDDTDQGTAEQLDQGAPYASALCSDYRTRTGWRMWGRRRWIVSIWPFSQPFRPTGGVAKRHGDSAALRPVKTHVQAVLADSKGKCLVVGPGGPALFLGEKLADVSKLGMR